MTQKKNQGTKRVINGLFWVTFGKGARVILQLLVIMILARLIQPEDFGVVSAAMIVIGFSDVFCELGLGAALIQRENIEQRHLSTATGFALIQSLLVAAVILALTPFIAQFFDDPQISKVLPVLAVLFPLDGLGMVPEALAQREMRFRWLAARDTICYGAGYFVFGIGLALYGYGVWALVAATISAQAIKTVLLLMAYPPKGFIPERKAIGELMYFGGGHTIARITNYLALQGDNLVVGRMLGMTALGIYGRAYQLMAMPAQVFGQILDKVLFPSMAKIQDKTERLGEAYMRGISLIALVMMPASVVAFILAPEIVALMLGNKWEAAVLPFRILTIGLLMRTSYKLSDSLARATGAVYRRAWRQTIYAALVIGGSALFSIWGIAGVSVGVLIAVTINFLLMAQLSLTIIERTWQDFFQVHLNALLSAIVVAVAVFPFVSLLRAMEVSAIGIVPLTMVLLALMGFFMIRYAAGVFIGAEGIWMMNMLQEYLPPGYRLNLSEFGAGIKSKPYGVEDANIENA